MRILITGGAGFVGSTLARYFRRIDSRNSVVVFDNLRRRGSELNIPILQSEGVDFVHGDVRNRLDLQALDGHFDVLVEASAEASVHAGHGTSPAYVIDTNILGAATCLEFARERCGGLVFLSSSRVYSIEPLTQLPLQELGSRLDIPEQGTGIRGVSYRGIDENFACDTARSFYGSSKLAAELLCQEYAADSDLRVVVNRCGVIAGPGQFGRTDQGVFTLWVARHFFGHALAYTGFGGKGLQVRDLLHAEDLCELLHHQIESWELVSGKTFNVGGGRAGSVSLQEYTALCQAVVGREVAITGQPKTASVDVPWYITNHQKISSLLGWTPQRSPRQIVEEIVEWVKSNEAILKDLIT